MIILKCTLFKYILSQLRRRLYVCPPHPSTIIVLCTQEIALSVKFVVVVVSIQRPVNSAKEHRFLGHPKHKNWARAILLRVVRTELRIDIWRAL